MQTNDSKLNILSRSDERSLDDLYIEELYKFKGDPSVSEDEGSVKTTRDLLIEEATRALEDSQKNVYTPEMMRRIKNTLEKAKEIQGQTLLTSEEIDQKLALLRKKLRERREKFVTETVNSLRVLKSTVRTNVPEETKPEEKKPEDLDVIE